MSGAKTARRQVVQRRVGGAEMALPLKSCLLNFTKGYEEAGGAENYYSVE